jgi:hypothetical protein
VGDPLPAAAPALVPARRTRTEFRISRGSEQHRDCRCAAAFRFVVVATAVGAAPAVGLAPVPALTLLVRRRELQRPGGQRGGGRERGRPGAHEVKA